jgi:RTX calcium-binding nonapeptide repeat (4 copies)
MALFPRLGLGAAIGIVLALAALPSFAQGKARISRSGDVVKITSDSGADRIANAGTDESRLISYSIQAGGTMRAGPGCERLRGPRVTRVIVACGAPSRSSVNPVSLQVKLGGGDDWFTAAPWNDVQPRLIADGGAGNDFIYGSTLYDDIKGGAGNDKLFGLDDEDNIDGGDGDDLIVGGAGDDGLIGGAGADNIYGDESKATSEWGNDLITAALDFTPDQLNCGEGIDQVIVDADDPVNANCENLAGGQSSPPRDTVGTLPLTVTIGSLARPPGGLFRVLHGEPIRMPVTFSAAAQISAKLQLSAAEANRLGVPAGKRLIANDIGTPLVLTPLTINTQMRLNWPVRKYLADDNLVRATLTIVATDVNGAATTATKDVVLRG